MKIANQFVPITQAKSRLLQIIRELWEQDGALTITRDGVPAAVLLSPERYGALLETIEILSDSRTMKSLNRSIKQARKGQWLDEEKVFGKTRE